MGPQGRTSRRAMVRSRRWAARWAAWQASSCSACMSAARPAAATCTLLCSCMQEEDPYAGCYLLADA